MASENKTKPSDDSVKAYLAKIADPQMRADCEALSAMMTKATKAQPVLWSGVIVGFGQYHYRYASGREGDSLLVGYRAQKDKISLYLSSGFEGYDELMARLGKHKAAKACVYIKRLSDVDPKILQKLIDATVREHKKQHVQ